MQNKKFEKYTRTCKYCGQYFEAKTKHTSVCENCRGNNHQHKILRTMNLL
jgi:hypothetical protein